MSFLWPTGYSPFELPGLAVGVVGGRDATDHLVDRGRGAPQDPDGVYSLRAMVGMGTELDFR